MSIDAKTVARLREMTGAGMMDAKKALEEVGGDLEKAAEELRKKGVTKAAKKSDRATSEGRVHAYIHATGKVGVLVEVLCETDFVARNENFIAFCNDLAMHIAASDPSYLTREDVPEEIVAKEKELVASALKEEGKTFDKNAVIDTALKLKLFDDNGNYNLRAAYEVWSAKQSRPQNTVKKRIASESVRGSKGDAKQEGHTLSELRKLGGFRGFNKYLENNV